MRRCNKKRKLKPGNPIELKENIQCIPKGVYMIEDIDDEILVCNVEDALGFMLINHEACPLRPVRGPFRRTTKEAFFRAYQELGARVSMGDFDRRFSEATVVLMVGEEDRHQVEKHPHMQPMQNELEPRVH